VLTLALTWLITSVAGVAGAPVLGRRGKRERPDPARTGHGSTAGQLLPSAGIVRSSR
jgi:hypothetical protein